MLLIYVFCLNIIIYCLILCQHDTFRFYFIFQNIYNLIYQFTQIINFLGLKLDTVIGRRLKLGVVGVFFFRTSRIIMWGSSFVFFLGA